MRSRRFSQIDVFSADPVRRQSAGGRARRRRPGHRDDAAVRALDESVGDDLPAARRRTRAPTTGCGSSPRPRSCRSPATRPWAAATPGWRPAARRGARTTSSRSAAPVSIRLRRDARAGLAFAAPPHAALRTGRRTRSRRHRRIARTSTRTAIVDAQWLVNGPRVGRGAAGERRGGPSPCARVVVDADIGIVGPCPIDAAEGIEVRAFFAVDGGTAEDPVTGSLNAAMAEWLLGRGRLTAPYVARQGTVLGRSGRVHISPADDEILWSAAPRPPACAARRPSSARHRSRRPAQASRTRT